MSLRKVSQEELDGILHEHEIWYASGMQSGKQANLHNVDLQNAYLARTDLTEAYLTMASLTQADLNGAGLTRANLSGADLSGANLSGANLYGADLTGVNLTGANLRYADFSFANLSRARLQKCIFTNAVIGQTIFSDNDLSETQGLVDVKHMYPSIISIDTLYLSQGKIPEEFLRGAGVPDNLITYLPSLLGSMEALQFYSCFLSYSSKDEEFATRLHSRLRDSHLRVWFAPEDMQGGSKLHDQVDEAIRIYDKLLIILSENSMQSDWVKEEILKARKKEKKSERQVLFPIRICDFQRLSDWTFYDEGKDMGREVREYFIPDFSTWKDHDLFEVEFRKLLDALNSKKRPASIPA
jgi:hypothetical protein